jgi:glycosyltransferase involved in cell wall biosynthesis
LGSDEKTSERDEAFGVRDIKPVILIGPALDDPTESVSAVNRSFVIGLSHRYQFVPTGARRRYGATRQSRFNSWNLYYLLKDAGLWAQKLLRYRPAIAHYAISSGWALEKSLFLLWIARAMGVRTVGHLHSGGFVAHWETLKSSRRRFAFAVLRRLDAIIVLSEGWRNVLAERVGIPKARIFVVNNPIDPDFEDTVISLPTGRAENVFLSLGVMGRDKGVFDIVEAVSLLRERTDREFQVRLVGPEREPKMRTIVTNRVEARSLETFIGIHGSVRGREKIAHFRHASIFLLPSYYENFPLVLLEAAAAGQAIITTPVGATPEFFVDGNSAIFVKPGDVNGLAKAMQRLLDDPAERGRLAAGAREVFLGQLTRTGILSSLDHIYQHVLGLPRNRSVYIAPTELTRPSSKAGITADIK